MIYVNPYGNIRFSEIVPNMIGEIIRDIIITNKLYDDKPYIAVYKEYKKHHSVYDCHPYLLYFKIPVIISEEYATMNFMEPSKDPYKEVSWIKHHIPEHFRIPKPLKDLIQECLQKCSPYMAKLEKQVDWDEYEEFLEYKWLSEWDKFFYAKNLGDMYDKFLSMIFTKFISLGGDNEVTIKNIINRTIEKNFKGIENS